MAWQDIVDGRRVEGVMRLEDGVGDDSFSSAGIDSCGESVGLGVVSREERKVWSSALELSF